MAWVAKYDHDPNARLDYTMDWAATEDADGNPILDSDGVQIKPYLQNGDSITVSTPTITDDNFAETTELTVDEDSFDGTTQIAWVQAVDAAAGTYLLTFYIETADGRKDERTVALIVKHR